MHYYKRNLGDYAKKAGKLTMLQHGSYTLLIDACYDREQFPTLEQALEWTWATTEDEIAAIKFVLSRFFRLDKDGQYVQPRILEELLDYHKKADKNKEIAIEREAKRKQYSTNRAQVVNESSPNHKPITNNHKPINNTTPDGFIVFWQTYPDRRKGAKSKCLEYWKKHNLEKQKEVIFAHMAKMNPDWTKDKGEYAPAPMSYLNKKAWDGAAIEVKTDRFAGAI